MKTYLVGGAVRDELLNYPFHEKDWVVVGASTEEMLAQGFQQVGKDFPVFLHPETQEEYALARLERKTGEGYKGFSFTTEKSVTLEQDLSRRDLTINAIAKDAHGKFIDPYNGQRDIEQRLLRHVSPAFIEDPVRTLRVARFAARYHHLGFQVAPDTLELMRHMANVGEVDHLVPERVWKEFSSALNEKHPEVFITTLRDTGILKIILPELSNLFGIPQPEKHHPEIDTGLHALYSLSKACTLSKSTAVRFASLLHDVGKALTPTEDLPKHHGHEQKGESLIAELCVRLKVPNDIRDLCVLVTKFHTHCHRALELKPATIMRTFESLDAFRRPERFNDFLLCCQADAQGRTGFTDKPYPQADIFRIALEAANRVQAKDLVEQGYKGKELGDELRVRRIKAIRNGIETPQ